MCVGQGIEQSPVLRADGALLGQELGQGFPGAGSPEAKGHDELVAGDHPVLQGQQTEKHIAEQVITPWHQLTSRPLAASFATCLEARSHVVKRHGAEGRAHDKRFGLTSGSESD